MILLNCAIVFFTLVTQFPNSIQGDFVTSSDYDAEIIANIPTPRGLYVDDLGDVLVIARGLSSVLALYQTDSGAWEQTLIVNGTNLGLNHGITYNKGFLYASSGSHVYRWPYEPGQRSTIESPEQIVVFNISIPNPDKVNTRTIIFDNSDVLYVTINSDLSIDQDSSWRCRIRRFDLSDPEISLPIDFETGEIFADGLRNEVGLAFDADGTLWGVENAGGGDYLLREELGEFPSLHEGNPGEELNRFDKSPGTHYGYPYCWGSYDLEGYEIGTQFSWPTAMADGIHTDEWCRNQSNNQKAAFFMPAHMAPLGIEFYSADMNNCGQVEGAFPCSAFENAVIAYHGSMNITIPVGYKVSMYTFDPNTKEPTGETIDIIYDNGEGTKFRPVNAVFNKLGHLIVSADSLNQIIRITYRDSSNGTLGIHV